LELVGYSVRSASYEFATSYSVPLDFLPHLFFPVWQGEPSEGSNNEYWAYFGFAPLVLALLAPFLRKNRRAIFLALFALGTLSLAVGHANPAYGLIYQLPGFSFFRAPARYLLLFVFAGALLCAIAFDDLAKRLEPTHRGRQRAWLWGIVLGGLFLLSLWLAESQPLGFWIAAWQILPLIFAAATLVLLILTRQRRLARATFQVIVTGLILFDLTWLAPLFVKTLGQVTSPASATIVPRSLSILDPRPGRERVLADQYIFPSVPAIRNSLYPNAALLYGKESANAYSSLSSAWHESYLWQLSPAMLNLLNVRYFTIPLEPRPRAKIAIPPYTLALNLLNHEEMIPPTQATAIEVSSFTEQADHLADGTIVGELNVRRRDGRVETFPLRLGIETADWDYERKQPPHQRAPSAHSFPAFWRAFGRMFEGHTYTARFPFAPNEIVGVSVRVVQPEVYLTIEEIILYNGNQAIALAKLLGKNDFRVAYFSDTAAVWRNRDVLPRAFIAHTAQVLDDAAAFARLRDPEFDPAREVVLSEGVELRDAKPSRDSVEIANYKPERVEIKATTDQPGYLVLADSWYPGWNAFVNGQPAPIQRANVIFRAVRIEPGTHDIVFEYRPLSFALGASISAASLLIVFGIAMLGLGKGQ